MKKLYYPISLISGFLFFLFFHLALIQRVYPGTAGEHLIKISRGDNLNTVANKLETEQIIVNKILFVIMGRVLGYQNQIIPGEYNFIPGSTNLEILKRITNPELVRRYTITIPEGMSIRSIGRLLSKNYKLDSARFVNETLKTEYLSELSVEANSLEGFLFPDTYEIQITAGGNPERDLVKMMFENFTKKINKEILGKIEQKKLKLKDVITMASIVEGETRFNPEKNTIAGVYYNRLRKNMKLEADPTVQYALPDGPKKRLMFSDLKIESPYNTYLYRGLPPGPINNPGLVSILAAIEPEVHIFLYFAAKGDGSHRFAETFEEHKKNATEYRKYLEEKENNK